MDRIPSEVIFSFSELRSTIDDIGAQWQLLLRVVANFTISINARQFYAEEEFPVVEFASQAAEWLRDDRGDLLYASMESEEKPLIGFYRQNGHFLAHSASQAFESTKTIDREVLRDALTSFIEELRRRTETDLALNIEAVL